MKRFDLYSHIYTTNYDHVILSGYVGQYKKHAALIKMSSSRENADQVVRSLTDFYKTLLYDQVTIPLPKVSPKYSLTRFCYFPFIEQEISENRNVPYRTSQNRFFQKPTLPNRPSLLYLCPLYLKLAFDWEQRCRSIHALETTFHSLAAPQHTFRVTPDEVRKASFPRVSLFRSQELITSTSKFRETTLNFVACFGGRNTL